MEEGIGDLQDKPPTLLILNKKDLIKPGEVAKKLEVGTHLLGFILAFISQSTGTDMIFPMFYALIISNCLQWYTKFTDVDDIIPVSAKFGQGVDDVKNWILSKLPNGPVYYPKAC